MWTYEYINKSILADSYIQTLVVYVDDIEYAREYVKMLDDNETMWNDFADSHIIYLQSMV
jgi:hypothetical protein